MLKLGACSTVRVRIESSRPSAEPNFADHDAKALKRRDQASRRIRRNRAVCSLWRAAETVVKRLASTGKISMLQPETA